MVFSSWMKKTGRSILRHAANGGGAPFFSRAVTATTRNVPVMAFTLGIIIDA
jgi:hypothetical protein